jgi:hypothetical protein
LHLIFKKNVHFSADQEEYSKDLLLSEKNVVSIVSNFSINITDDQFSPPKSPSYFSQGKSLF